MKMKSAIFAWMTLMLLNGCGLITPGQKKSVSESQKERPVVHVPLADPFILLHDGTYYAYGTKAEHGIAVFDLIQAGAGNHIFFARRNGHTWGIRISRERAARRYTVHIFSEESDIRGTYSCPPGLLLTTIELRFNDLATP